MNSRVKVSAFRFLAMAAACALAWSSAMAATGPGDRGDDRTAAPRLNFLFEKDAYGAPAAQTGAVEPHGFSRLAIRLYGGFSRVAAGDLNDGSDGFFELLEVYEALGFGTAEGGYEPMHGGYNFGGDLIFRLSPAIGIGLGVGYLRSSEDPEMTLTDGIDTLALTARPVISAMPIRLGLFLTVPLAGKINLTADAGAAYYARLKFEAMQRLEFAADDWVEMSLSASRSSLSANLGFQGSLGFEYELSPRLGFFVEAVGRYARFKNFDLVTGANESSGGTPQTTEGRLYIESHTFTDGAYSVFTIEETPPVDNPPSVTYREPKIDLSGFSLQTGIRIRF